MQYLTLENGKAVLQILGSIGVVCTLVGTLLSKIGGDPSSKLFHLGQLFLSGGVDIGKGANAASNMLDKKPAGFARTGLIVFMVSVSSGALLSCAYVKTVAKAELQCLKDDGISSLADLVPLLAREDWADAVTEFGKSNEALCAIKAFAEGASPPATPPPPPPKGVSIMTLPPTDPHARIKAKCWLQAHGYK